MTYICLPPSTEPLSFSIAAFAEASDSNWTKPYPLLFPSSEVTTLQDNISPNFWNISWSLTLSIESLKFYNKNTRVNCSVQIRGSWNNVKDISKTIKIESKIKNQSYLNEDISHSTSSCIRITVRPHNPYHFSIQCGMVFQFNSTNGYTKQGEKKSISQGSNKS